MKIKSILIAFLFSINLFAGVNEDLLESVKAGSLESTVSNLKKNGDPNFKANNAKPLLSIAAEKGNLEIVRILIERGAFVNATETAKDTRGWTALMYATESGNLEVVKLLLEKGANKNQRNGKNFDALYLAELWGHNEIASLLGGMKKKYRPIEKTLI